MKIIFFGSSQFAVPVLKSLLDSEHEVKAIVTKSEKPAGRGLKEKPTDIKIFADKYAPDVKLIQPLKLRDSEFQDDLRAIGADIFTVASFPIMPMTLVNIPPNGCMNVHPSLLPKYRGAAPIRWTLLNGETKTGVSTFFIGGKVDAGSILKQVETEILPEEIYTELHDRLAQIGAGLALDSLKMVESGSFTTKIQDETHATPAPKINKELTLIDWDNPAESIYNKVRAFADKPGAFTFLNGKRMKILKCRPDRSGNIPPFMGECEKNTLSAGCRDGSIEILELQMEGKKKMSAEVFLRGFKGDKIEFSMSQ